MSETYQNSKNCIYKQGTILQSYGNYYYNININGSDILSLIFLDSQQLGFTNEHTNWYEQTINTIKSNNDGNILPSLAFFHIPTIETQIAYDLYSKGLIDGDGTLREVICHQETNSNFFDKVLELQSTKALFYGHDHINNLILNYKDIKLVYGLKTGRSSYYNPHIQGGNLITINANSSFDVQRIYI